MENVKLIVRVTKTIGFINEGPKDGAAEPLPEIKLTNFVMSATGADEDLARIDLDNVNIIASETDSMTFKEEDDVYDMSIKILCF